MVKLTCLSCCQRVTKLECFHVEKQSIKRPLYRSHGSKIQEGGLLEMQMAQKC